MEIGEGRVLYICSTLLLVSVLAGKLDFSVVFVSKCSHSTSYFSDNDRSINDECRTKVNATGYRL